MSFICGKCETKSGNRVKPIKVVTEYRNIKTGGIRLPNEISSPSGYQIHREINACPSCASLPEYQLKETTQTVVTPEEVEGLTHRMNLETEGTPVEASEGA